MTVKRSPGAGAGRWRGVWTVPAALACAASGEAAQPDYNRDCKADFHDQVQFLDAFAAGRSEADINLDTVVNTQDYELFFEVRPSRSLQFYWVVSTLLEGNRRMDSRTDLTGLPISRNCHILYEQHVPNPPLVLGPNGEQVERGYHILFRGVDGTYGSWKSNYESWRARYVAELPPYIANTVPADFDGFYCLDFEAVLPLLEMTVWQAGDRAQETAWLAMLEQINGTRLDPELLTFAAWEPPAGVTAWGDLTSEQQAELASVMYEKVGVDHFVLTVQLARSVRPQAKFGYYGMPTAYWPTTNDERRGWTDRLMPLWAECDILAPSTYQLYYTTLDPSSSPCPEQVNTPGNNWNFFRSMMDEAHRIRRVLNRPGQQIVPFVWWRYKDQAGSCAPSRNPDLLVGDTNLRHMVYLPWLLGADSIAFWGHYGIWGPGYAYPWLDTPESIGQEIRTRWAPHLRAVACPKP